jgi:HD-GYP domain-containing protein (c-di-GMP phosphodiesterase class II)
MSNRDQTSLLENLQRLNVIGIALSAEQDINRLLEMILQNAMDITNADGGSLYLVTEDRRLRFEIMVCRSLAITMGGTTGNPIPYDPIPMYDASGNPNLEMVAAYAAIKDRAINIADAYHVEGFDFSGTRAFDKKTGYHSKSFLTIPMTNHENEVIGVLQLLNAMDEKTGEVVAFSEDDRELVESLSSQAAVALTNRRLLDEQRILFESFIKLIASAIDEKSPYTGGHCARVPELTMMLAEAAHDSDIEPLRDFSMTEEERYELSIAAWLHDCGKVTTPEYVVDKATKLETIYDRIDLVNTRFEILLRDARIALLEARLHAKTNGDDRPVEDAEQAYRQTVARIVEEKAFLQHANIGGEFMSEEHKQRVEEIAAQGYTDADGNEARLLTENEVYNLNIPRGTLTPEERKVINNHIVMTIQMLESLPYPKKLRKVPEYAGGHHERMDGKGYPRGLTREQMSIPARIMGIADIFEALTAKDRPYKRGKTLSESLFILGKMKEDNHVDPDLFDLFIRKKIYRKYADRFVAAEQIDEVDETKIPGFEP